MSDDKRYTIRISIIEVDAQGGMVGEEYEWDMLDHATSHVAICNEALDAAFEAAEGHFRAYLDPEEHKMTPRCPESEPEVEESDE
jgi:hypothetical protein